MFKNLGCFYMTRKLYKHFSTVDELGLSGDDLHVEPEHPGDHLVPGEVLDEGDDHNAIPAGLSCF